MQKSEHRQIRDGVLSGTTTFSEAEARLISLYQQVGEMLKAFEKQPLPAVLIVQVPNY